MASVNIKIKGLNKLQSAFKKAPSQVRSEVNDGISTSLAILERTAKQLVPVDTGRLRSSHRQKQSRMNMSGELFPTAKYAYFVHEGTRPHFPPLGKRGVGNWAKRRGLEPYVVGRAISRYGTPNQPWLTATATQERNRIERIMQKAVNMAIIKAFK